MSTQGFTVLRDSSKRRIQHTPKVQDILTSSLKKAFKEGIKDVGTMHNKLCQSMEERQNVPDVKGLFVHWLELNRQAKQLYDSLEDYIGTEACNKELTALQKLDQPYLDLWAQVEEYCEEKFELNMFVEDEDPVVQGSQSEPNADNIQLNDNPHVRSKVPAQTSGSVPKVDPASPDNGETPEVKPEIPDTHHKEEEARELQEIRDQTRELEKQILRLQEELNDSMRRAKKNNVPELTGQRNASTPIPGTDLAHQSNLETSMMHMFDRLASAMESRGLAEQLPKLEPDTFAGDPLAFASWWSSFKLVIQNKTTTDQERLCYLLRYTTGDAYDSIKCFRNLMDIEDSYQKAINILHSTFGTKLVVAEAYKETLNNWPSIKDNDSRALQKFGNYLMQCNTAMDSLKYLSNLDSQEEIVKLVRKLPRALQYRWYRHADNHMYGKDLDLTSSALIERNEYPSFSMFTNFVLCESRIMGRTGVQSGDKGVHSNVSAGSGPRHRSHNLGTRTGPAVHSGTKSRGSNTSATEKPRYGPERPTPSCIFCKGDHYISSCTKFLDNSSDFKLTYAKSRGLCFGCLRKSHLVSDCKWRNPSLMKSPKSAVSMRTLMGQGARYSMVVPVWVSLNDNSENQILTYALLDSQSNTSFMSEDLCEQLVSSAPVVELELVTMGATQIVRTRRIEDVRVSGFPQSATYPVRLKTCYTRPMIPGDHSCIPVPEVVANDPIVGQIAAELAPVMHEIDIGLLLGYDCINAMKPLEVVQHKDSNMFAILTPLGWTVTGSPLDDHEVRPVMCCRTFVKEMTSKEMRQVFDIGFEEPGTGEKMMSADDIKFLDIMQKGLRTRDGRIELPFPFKQEPGTLPPSRPRAVRRVYGLKRKMDRDPIFKEKYCGFMNDLVKMNKSEPVPQPDRADPSKCFYWCHHNVTNPKKPEKVRSVFSDGSEQGGEFSFNDLLLQGPDLTNNLVGVLLRYRMHRVPFKSDIEGMFYAVLLWEEHRDMARYVWFQDGDPSKPLIDYRMKVHLFGAKSSPGCANFALRATADMYEDKYGSEVAEFIRKNFYVDDGMGGSDTKESTVQLMQGARAMLRETSFNLHKFSSCDPEVLLKLPPEIRDKGLQDISLSQENLPLDKALGLDVSLKNDSFEYKVKLTERPLTRRGCLSGLSSVYDPLGLVGPAILPGRLQLQLMCSSKLDWDDDLTVDQKEDWKRWYRGLEALHRLSVPRCVKKNIQHEIKLRVLHTFCDASISGLGNACYLHLKDNADSEDITLLFGKSRVAPSKITTVPRLELQAAVMGVKIANFIKSELGFDDLILVFWSDSTIVLIYIHNEDKRFYMYVTNRANFIRENSEKKRWRHVSTERNPADLASRGCSAEELVGSPLWWEGPTDIISGYTDKTEELPEISPDDPEIRKACRVYDTWAQHRQLLVETAERFSSWNRLIGCIARILKLGTKLLDREAPLAECRERAQILLIKAAQKEAYPEYFRGCMEPRGSLSSLDPFLDSDGALRVGGRSQKAGLEFALAHPLILPRRGVITDLVIRHHHVIGQHMSVGPTLNSIRAAGLWLINGRASTRYRLMSCVTCKRRRGKVVSPKMGELPMERLTPSAPFTNSAVDVFGPYKVIVGRAQRKRWCSIFVCLVTRAVHLEVLHSLDTNSYILAYRRFVNRRGKIKSLKSDRGTNFIGYNSELSKAMSEMDKERIGEVTARDGCDFVLHDFNFPKASHMAGSWERMIRTVRAAMDYTLAAHGTRLDDETLATVVTESEAIVNSRPISYVSGSDFDESLPLSPSMLLTMRHSIAPPLPGEHDRNLSTAQKRWCYVQSLASMFWSRWRQEILPTLNERKKWQKVTDNLVPGDVVLVVDEQCSRVDWPMGRVSEVYPGADGHVRKVQIRVRGKLLDRPARKLILLVKNVESIPIEEPQTNQ